jgi:hypothetical protein
MLCIAELRSPYFRGAIGKAGMARHIQLWWHLLALNERSDILSSLGDTVFAELRDVIERDLGCRKPPQAGIAAVTITFDDAF